MSHDEVVHVDAGIVEGTAKVPGWYILAVVLLGLAYVIYLGDFLVGAQPSSAQIRRDKPAAAAPAETPAEAPQGDGE
jgi:hypothetical protein